MIQVNNPEAHLLVQEGKMNMDRKEWAYVAEYLNWKSTQSIFVQIWGLHAYMSYVKSF